MNGFTRQRAITTNGRRRLLRLWTEMGGARGVLVGALPVAILIASPNRVDISLLIAVIYLGAAVVIARPTIADRPALLYAVAAAALVGFTMVRIESIQPLDAAQLSVGLEKGMYVLAFVLPMAVAAALLVSSPDDLRPAAVVFLAIGLATATGTLLILNTTLFGYGRYTAQGNLIAAAPLILAQFWIIRNARIAIGLAIPTLIAMALTQSRQSFLIVAIGFAATGVYWLLTSRIGKSAGKPSSIARFLILPSALYATTLVIVSVWGLLLLASKWVTVPLFITDPVACQCIAGRFWDIFFHQGGRNVLLEEGWNLFTKNPVFGNGLGSFSVVDASNVFPFEVTHYVYPHNIALEIAGEVGLVGLVVLLVPLVVAWLRLAFLGIRTGSEAVATAIMIVLMYAVVANLSGDIASQRGLWVFGLVVLKLAFRPAVAEAR